MILISLESIVLILSASIATAHGVADGGNHHLRHDTRSSASLKVKEPLLGGRTSIQTDEYSRVLKLNAFKNDLLPWLTNHAKKTDTDLVEFSRSTLSVYKEDM
jgi:hypothetical protein